MDNVQYLISGKVQGVGFRAYVRRSATQLGLSGWVRNLDDGRVQCVVNNDPSACERLKAFLDQGPRWSTVEQVSVTNVSEEIKPDCFEILPTHRL